MKIVVCVKQVPDTTEVRIDPVKGTMIRDGVPSILNPDDKNALEEALKIKETREGIFVTVITMGPPAAEEILYECLSMGADEAILVSDRAFGGSDTWATSNILSEAIKKTGDFDLVFAGRQAIDGDTAQVGPQIAEKLGIPQITYVRKLEFEKDEVLVERALEDGYHLIRARPPLLLTAMKELNSPRYMNMHDIVDAYKKKKIVVWSNDDLKVDEGKIGLLASPTRVRKTFTPEVVGRGRVFSGPPKESVVDLLSALKTNHII